MNSQEKHTAIRAVMPQSRRLFLLVGGTVLTASLKNIINLTTLYQLYRLYSVDWHDDFNDESERMWNLAW
jgi:hypothetical protein